MASHTTIWSPIPAGHPLLTAAGIREGLQLPAFLDGEEFEAFERTRSAAITPKALLFGAALSGQNEAPTVDAESVRRSLPPLFEAFCRGFKFKDLDHMFTSVAAVLRERHGSALSRRALTNALQFYPSLNRTRSDLIGDLWMLAVAASNQSDRSHLLLLILKNFTKLERGTLAPGPRAFVCYAAVVVRGLLGLEHARKLYAELEAEIAEGDGGELRARLGRFLSAAKADWSLVSGVQLGIA